MIAVIAIVITVAAIVCHFWLLLSEKTTPRSMPFSGQAPSDRGGQKILLGFAVVVLAFGVFAAWHYWAAIEASADHVFLLVGLLLTMIAGMLVRVVSSNYKDGRQLFSVTVSQVAYPLLFSPIVFFSVLSLSSDKSSAMFLFQAAFVNGYFWESLVSDAKPVK